MSDVHMITASGRDHLLGGCGVLMNAIDVEDIAWQLAQINRFTGACNRPYSVAEHSLLVADLAAYDGRNAMLQLLCLTHDAHEAYTGDASSPVKRVIGAAWHEFESAHAHPVRRALGLMTGFTVHRQLVNHYDIVALSTERRDLTRYASDRNKPWWVLDTPGAQVPPASWVDLNEPYRRAAPWTHWRDQFHLRYLDLKRRVQAEAAQASLENAA